MADVKAYQLFCRSGASDTEHGVVDKTRAPLSPDNL